jgi:hypothetical protein
MIIPEFAPSSAGLRRAAAGWTGLRRTEACGAGLCRRAAALAAGAARRTAPRAAGAVRPVPEALFFGLRTELELFLVPEAFFDE